MKNKDAKTIISRAKAMFGSIHYLKEISVPVDDKIRLNLVYQGICLLQFGEEAFWLWNKDWGNEINPVAIDLLASANISSKTILKYLGTMISIYRKEAEKQMAFARKEFIYLRRVWSHYSRIARAISKKNTRVFNHLTVPKR